MFQVGGLGSKLEVLETFLGFILGIVWRQWGLEGLWEGLGWPEGGWGPRNGPNMDPTLAELEPTWSQDGPNLSQLGANLGPCWVQIGSSRPSCSNYEGTLRPLSGYTTQDAKNDPTIVEFCSKKCQKLMLSNLPKSKNTLENVGPEANREKTATKLKHIN